MKSKLIIRQVITLNDAVELFGGEGLTRFPNFSNAPCPTQGFTCAEIFAAHRDNFRF